MIRPPPRSAIFPYTTLFRSVSREHGTAHAQVFFFYSNHKNEFHLKKIDGKSRHLNSSHSSISDLAFFFNDTAPPEICYLSLHDALPICFQGARDGSRPIFFLLFESQERVSFEKD